MEQREETVGSTNNVGEQNSAAVSFPAVANSSPADITATGELPTTTKSALTAKQPSFKEKSVTSGAAPDTIAPSLDQLQVTGGKSPRRPTAASMAGSQSLSIFQKKMLMQTYAHVQAVNTKGVGQLAYQRLLTAKPELRELFQKASAIQSFIAEQPGAVNGTLPCHVKLLNDLMDQIIGNLDSLDVVGERCVEFGEAHAHMHAQGFSPDLWDTFGEVLLQTIAQLDVVRKHRELVKAWTALISFMVDRFRQGYRQGVRKVRYSTSKQGQSAFATTVDLPTPND